MSQNIKNNAYYLFLVFKTIILQLISKLRVFMQSHSKFDWQAEEKMKQNDTYYSSHTEQCSQSGR